MWGGSTALHTANRECGPGGRPALAVCCCQRAQLAPRLLPLGCSVHSDHHRRPSVAPATPSSGGAGRTPPAVLLLLPPQPTLLHPVSLAPPRASPPPPSFLHLVGAQPKVAAAAAPGLPPHLHGERRRDRLARRLRVRARSGSALARERAQVARGARTGVRGRCGRRRAADEGATGRDGRTRRRVEGFDCYQPAGVCVRARACVRVGGGGWEIGPPGSTPSEGSRAYALPRWEVGSWPRFARPARRRSALGRRADLERRNGGRYCGGLGGMRWRRSDGPGWRRLQRRRECAGSEAGGARWCGAGRR